MPAPRLHIFSVTPTGDLGYDTKRPRYRVVCSVCKVVLHESTTGISVWIAKHVAGEKCAYERPLREGETP
jgi:hypothetical protein